MAAVTMNNQSLTFAVSSTVTIPQDISRALCHLFPRIPVLEDSKLWNLVTTTISLFCSPITMEFLMRSLVYLSLLFCCTRAMVSRPKTVELALMSSVSNTEGIQYFVNLTVGTPGQPQTVFIDTGSSNTVLFSSNASFNNTPGSVGGTFDSTHSSTFEMIKAGALNLYFGLGTTWFNGDYVRDVVQISM